MAQADDEVVQAFQRTGTAVFAYRRFNVIAYAAVFLALGFPALLLPLFAVRDEPALLIICGFGALSVFQGLKLIFDLRAGLQP